MSSITVMLKWEGVMNLKQLDAFRAVMLTGSVTNASEWLHVSQPAVSRLISDLERSLGFELFVRSKGMPVSPTAEATSFYEEVQRSFAGLEALSKVGDDIRNFRGGQLRVACLPALAMGFLPKMINSFSIEHPDVSIQLQARSSSTVHQWIAAQQFDLGIARPASFPGVDVRPFLRVAGVCVLPPGHRLSARRVVNPQDIVNERFISLAAEDLTRSPIDQMFDQIGDSRQVVVETQYAATICGLVLENVGCSIVNPVTTIDFRDRGLVVRRLEPEIVFEYVLVLPAHRKPSRVTQSFLDSLRSGRDKIAGKLVKNYN